MFDKIAFQDLPISAANETSPLRILAVALLLRSPWSLRRAGQLSDQGSRLRLSLGCSPIEWSFSATSPSGLGLGSSRGTRSQSLSRPNRRRGQASTAGAWQVSLSRQGSAGGPFDLTVASGAQRIDVPRRSRRRRVARFGSIEHGVHARAGGERRRSDRRRERSPASSIQSANVLVDRAEDELVGGDWTRRRRAARRRIHRGRILLRARAAKDRRRSDRHHQHHVGRQQHRDVDEPTRTRLTDSGGPRSCAARTRTIAPFAIRFCAQTRRALPTKDSGLVNDNALWADPSLDDSRVVRRCRCRPTGRSKGIPGWTASRGIASTFDLDAREAQRGVDADARGDR